MASTHPHEPRSAAATLGYVLSPTLFSAWLLTEFDTFAAGVILAGGTLAPAFSIGRASSRSRMCPLRAPPQRIFRLGTTVLFVCRWSRFWSNTNHRLNDTQVVGHRRGVVGDFGVPVWGTKVLWWADQLDRPASHSGTQSPQLVYLTTIPDGSGHVGHVGSTIIWNTLHSNPAVGRPPFAVGLADHRLLFSL